MIHRPISAPGNSPQVGSSVQVTPRPLFAAAPYRAAPEPIDQRRRIAQIEAMIAEMDRVASDLEREIAAEQVRSGIADPTHYAYPTYAKAAMARRDNLRRSIEKLREFTA